MSANPLSSDLPADAVPDLEPDVSHLITEDDTPVDDIYSEKQQRLLTEPPYASWAGPGNHRPFVALANVGLFPVPKNPALVPDMMLSLDVKLPENAREKKHRSYMIWVYGKPPEVVIEVVSNREGGEDTEKLETYARMGVSYYVIWDPDQELGEQPLRMFCLVGGEYEPMKDGWIKKVGLRLQVWHGVYEDWDKDWLRWCNRDGVPIPTGAERADAEQKRADDAVAKAARMAAQLRALGVEPNGK